MSAISKTYYANIYIGLQEGYDNTRIHSIVELHKICLDYCNEIKLGLTITPTKFIYVDGMEDGAIIGLINYPRFPKSEGYIQMIAQELAYILMNKLGQERCSIVCPDDTIMLEKEV